MSVFLKMVQGLFTRKRIVIVSAVLIFLSAVFFLLIPFAKAMTTSEQFVFLKAIQMLSNFGNEQSIVTNDFFGTSTERLWELLLKDDSNGYAVPIMQIVCSIASTLIALYFFVQLIRDYMTGKELTYDIIFKLFIKLAITFPIINNINYLLNLIHYFAKELAFKFDEIVGDAIGRGTAEHDTLVRIANNMTTQSQQNTNLFGVQLGSGAIGVLLSILIAFIFWIILKVIMIVVEVLVYAVVFELIVRKIFMPLALLGLIEGGYNSSGAKYIKKYIALYFKIFAFIVVFAVVDSFSIAILENFSLEGDFFTQMVSLSFQFLLVNFAAVSLCSKTGTIANEVVGA